MKKTMLAAALAAACFATPAFAQDAPSFTGGHVSIVGGLDHVSAGGDGESSATYGLGLGYDFAVGRNMIAGLEAEITDSSTEECGVGGCTDAGRDLYVGARFGTVVGRNALVYVKAGYTNARAVFENATTRIGTNLDGIRVGAGTEVRLGGGPFFVKAEYRYSNYEADVSRHQGVIGVGLRF